MKYFHHIISFIQKQHTMHIALVALLIILPVLVVFVQQRSSLVAHAAEVQLSIDVHVEHNQATNAQKVSSPAFSTTEDGELIVVLLASDGPQSGGQKFSSVVGGGLTFQLAKRANTQKGVAEAWYAYAPSKLTSVIITATRAKGSYHGMIDVIAFKGAQNILGATVAGGASSGAAGVSLTTTASNSWVWGIGNDWDGASARVLGSDNIMSRQFVDTIVGDTFWSQYYNTTTLSAGTTVELNTIEPTNHSWNMVAVEILPAAPQPTVTPLPTVPPVTTHTIWPNTAIPTNPADTDSQAVEVGVKFKASVDGNITGIRFYKAAENTGTHIGNLWTLSGQKLATATFSAETVSGWQEVTFETAVPIQANTVYVASYHAPNGRYAGDNNYFATSGTTNGPLTALSNAEAGGNGVYQYGSTSSFPTQSYGSSNYWVDVVFTTTNFIQPTQVPDITPTPTIFVPPAESYTHEAGQPWAHTFPEKPGLLTPESELTPYTGPTTFNSGTVTIENALITQNIYMPAESTAVLKLRNVKIKAAAMRAIDARGGTVQIEHAFIDGVDNSNEPAVIMGNGDGYIRYSEIINVANPIRLGEGDTAEYNLLHRFPPVTAEGNAHSDGIEIYYGADASRQEVVRGNFIDLGNVTWPGHASGEGQTGQINATSDFGWIRNLLIEGNTLLAGGTYSVYLDGRGYCNCGDIDGVTVRNNKLFSSETQKYGGYYGSHTVESTTNITWQNNTFWRYSDGRTGAWRAEWIWPGSNDDIAFQ